MKKDKVLLWVSRVCLVAATLIAWYYGVVHPEPSSAAGSLWFAPDKTLAIVLTLLTVFSSLWPGTGGIISILYVLLELFVLQTESRVSLVSPLPSSMMVVFVMLGLGSISGLVYRFTSAKPSGKESPVGMKVRRYARVAGILAFVLVMVLTFTDNGEFYLLVIPISIISLVIAWFWPAPGGVLSIVVAALIILLVPVSYGYFLSTRLVYIPLVILGAAGLAQIFGAWKLGLLRYG